MANLDPAVIIALLGAGGLGAFVKDIIEGLWKLRRGVSAKETKRRIDVVQQRDEAMEREARERERADRAERNVGRLREYATILRIELLEKHVAKQDLESWPDLEQTMPASQIRPSQVRRNIEGEPDV